MKYIITQEQKEKINKRIYSYIESLFNIGDDVRIEQAKGAIIIDDGDYNNYFIIYLPEWWNTDNPKGLELSKLGVILTVENSYEHNLTKIFGDLWHDPIKEFINNNFNIKIDKVEF